MNKDINSVLLQQMEISGSNLSQTTSTETHGTADVETVYWNEAYTDENIESIEYNEKPELITLLGFSEYGKSTFTGSLYQILRTNESFADYSFVDSETLVGFERRVFLRKVNNEGKSEVKRTIRKKGSLLDIKLKNKTDNSVRRILLSDGAGEVYNECISKDATVIEQKAIKYANRLLVFVNCEEFSDPTKPWKDSLKTLLERFSRNDMLPINAKIYLVVNKYDKIARLEKNKVEEYIEEIFHIVSDYLTIYKKDIYRIVSTGLNIEKEDEGLTNLITSLLSPINRNENRYNELDWLATATKNIK